MKDFGVAEVTGQLALSKLICDRQTSLKGLSWGWGQWFQVLPIWSISGGPRPLGFGPAQTQGAEAISIKAHLGLGPGPNPMGRGVWTVG